MTNGKLPIKQAALIFIAIILLFFLFVVVGILNLNASMD